MTNGNAKGSVLAYDEEEGGMPRGPSSLNSARASSGLCAICGFRLALLQHTHTHTHMSGQSRTPESDLKQA